jgi:hypothetical protein
MPTNKTLIYEVIASFEDGATRFDRNNVGRNGAMRLAIYFQLVIAYDAFHPIG